MVPFFIITVSIFLGFRSIENNEITASNHFTAGFEFTPGVNPSSKSAFLTSKYFIATQNDEKTSLTIPFIVPDSTEKLKGLPDSTVKSKKPIPDSTVNLKSLPDSTLKSKSEIAADSTNIGKSVIHKDSTTVDSTKKIKDLLPEDLLLQKISIADSIRAKAKQDSLKRIETLSQDSTARLKYFRYNREDYPSVLFSRKKPSAFFARPTEGTITRITKLDSTGTIVTIQEMLGGKPYRVPINMSLDEYMELRLDAISRETWEAKGYEYKLKENKKDLTQLITDLTNIDIPLPSSPLLSIFGRPNINLKINGQVDIHGAWRNETTTGVTTSALGNTRNEPDFKQTVQINLAGTIGDKLTLGADWNTERQFQYENQLKLKYTGFEDEIIQSIEAGNVSLQTSPLIGGSEALFGVKAQFKMGAFSLTALASQKKSEIQEVAVSGGAKSQKFEIHAYDYSPNHFFIHEMYADTVLNIFNNYYGSPVPKVKNDMRVKDIEVWKTITGLANPNERKGNAYIDLPNRRGGEIYSAQLRDSTRQSIPGVEEIDRRFIKLEKDIDYVIHWETGFITFKTQIQEQDAIAVAFRVENTLPVSDDDVYYGEFISDLQSAKLSRLVLQLVKPPNLQPQFKKAWMLQLRNIYPIGGRDVKEEGFTLDMFYRVEGRELENNFQGVKLLEKFGLDKTDKSGTSTQPDGAFDFFPNRTIFPNTGEVVFPVLQPFGKDFPVGVLPDSLKYEAIYDTTVTFAKQDRTKDKFVLSGEYSASVSSVYNIGFNVVENSVKVLLNGGPLREGSDYSVDYNLGQILIRNDNALVPGADLRITYEQNDLFQLASKTLLGFRGLYEFNRETTLGFSFLNLNQQTLSDKVRIGEEPLNNSIYGADFKTNINLPFITKALDKVISTAAPSSFSMNAEYAYINPDPNTKKSTISSDDGRSIAYIDDFEGAKRIIPLGMGYGQWKDISIPNELPYISSLPKMIDVTSTPIDAQMNYKAKTYWFNVTPSDVTIKDIYGDRKKAAPDASLIQALDLDFNPSVRGTYNWNPTLLSDPKKSWGGFMKTLSSTANNLVEENIEFIEFWLNTVTSPKDLKINIDLGQISEDVIPDGKLGTEDINSNDLVDEGEDTGIDGWKDFEEPYYNSANNPDPSGDNYSFQLTQKPDYSHVNGNEGNAVAIDLGRLPDSEDLNRNFTLDRTDSYFRYEIPIDTNRAINKFVQGGGGSSNWYLYRIPLKDWVKKYGDPSFSVVEFVRIWVSDVTEPVHIRFAEMNLVGNQWQKVLTPKGVIPEEVTLADTVLTVSTINVEDNPEYVSPPGVFREKDRTQPNYEIFKNEQALNLVLKDLEDGKKREVVRYLYKPLDVFNYKEMKLFIHSDQNELPGSVSYYDPSQPNNYASEVYIRFGSDSTNYYEYRQPVRYNSDPAYNGWDEVSMVFAQLTAIKQERDSASSKLVYSRPVSGKPGHTYGVRGEPTLTRVTFFTIGIINPGDKGTYKQEVSGSIWINELRVLEADATPGWAYSANASLRLADLFSVSGNISQKNPYFHSLADRFGSRQDNLNWGISADLDILKLLPVNLAGSNLKITYSRTEQKSSPLFTPGRDIKISEAQNLLRQSLTEKNVDPAVIETEVAKLKDEAETENVSETWALSNMKIKIPTDLWYIRDVFNNLSFSFNYNKAVGKSPTVLANNSWVWNASASYAVNFSPELYFKPVDIPFIGSVVELFSDYRDVKFYFLPQSLTAQVTANRKRAFTQNRTSTGVAPPNILRDFTSTRGAGFNWIITEGGLLNLSLSYNFDVSSTLAYLLTVDNKDLERSESEIWREIFGGNLFGKDFNYKQSFDLRTNPKLPSIWDLNRYITLNGGYSVSYNWQNNFTQAELGRSAGYSNRITMGLSVRVKSIFAPLFKEESIIPTAVPVQQSGKVGGRGRPRSVPQKNVEGAIEDVQPLAQDSTVVKTDSLTVAEQDSVRGPSAVEKSLEYLKLGFKWLLLDYDNVSVNFSQASSYVGSGLAGEGTGFNNFWGVSQNYSRGPSRLFMLGFSNNVGPRAPLGNLQDTYTQKNDLTFKTQRPLWEGAQLDLNWSVGWSVNKGVTIQTDSLGGIQISSPLSTGTLDRSFLSLPSTLMFSFLGNGIKKVDELYNPLSNNPGQSLSDAFLEGFETFSVLSKIPILSNVAKYIPRPNWSFTWGGLEKYSIFSFAKRVQLNHAYVSNYSEGWKIAPGDTARQIQTQRVDYSFAPLLGLTLNFDQFFGGTFQSSFRFSTKSSFSLGISTRNITEAYNKDINISASYTKSGFEFPLFGISFKNDIEVSFSYTSGKTSSVIYDMENFKENGTPQEGKTNTTIEPKIRFVMSQSVSLTVFYRRTSIEPEGASRIPPTTTNEAGVDVRIAIQGR